MELNDLFERLDSNQSGTIDFQEFKQGIDLINEVTNKTNFSIILHFHVGKKLSKFTR